MKSMKRFLLVLAVLVFSGAPSMALAQEVKDKTGEEESCVCKQRIYLDTTVDDESSFSEIYIHRRGVLTVSRNDDNIEVYFVFKCECE